MQEVHTLIVNVAMDLEIREFMINAQRTYISTRCYSNALTKTFSKKVKEKKVLYLREYFEGIPKEFIDDNDIESRSAG